MGILDKLFGEHKPKYKTLGNTEPVCPYCAKPLDKMPGRKTKCPFCANYMYVRTRPADKKRVVVTEQDAAKINEQWMVESGTVFGQSSAQPYEGPPMVQAIKYAQERGAHIAAKYGLTLSSANRLAQIVSNGIKTKRGIPGLARDIRKEFPDMTTERAEIIARTETCDALEQAFMDNAEAMGVTGKEWICGPEGAIPPVCDICRANAAIGAIPLKQIFPGGVMRPPQHDGCRCALAPAMLPKKERI